MSKAVVLIVALAAIAICVFTLASRNREVGGKAICSTAGAVAKSSSSPRRVTADCANETERALNKMGLTMKNSVGVKVTHVGNQ
jgi:hypothetical protein